MPTLEERESKLKESLRRIEIQKQIRKLKDEQRNISKKKGK